MGAKHKKTLQQKIIADYRRELYTLENTNISLSANPKISTVEINNNSSYSYVLHDVAKTGILTLLIIAAQIVLFFLLKNHIISLPNISY